MFLLLTYMTYFYALNNIQMNYGNKEIGIYINYEDHPPPHVHVRRGGIETRVVIPTLRILSGPGLSIKEQNLIIQNMDTLCDEYDRINPKRHKRK